MKKTWFGDNPMTMGARRGGQEGALAPPPPGNSKI